jgi:hypothetical protein
MRIMINMVTMAIIASLDHGELFNGPGDVRVPGPISM